MDKNVDMHLLACFDALMTERQVTRAANRMEMSQPAMSSVLSRLRIVFGDPLLVRTPHGMVPTPRALEIVEHIRQGLFHIDKALTHGGGFDPATAELTVWITTTDYAAVTLMPALIAKLAKEAPGIKIAIRTTAPTRLREDLESGDNHLAIGYFRVSSGGIYSSALMEDTIACVARADHPTIHDGLGLEEYIGARHAYFAGISPADITPIEEITDAALSALGYERTISFRMTNILVILPVVAATDLLATLPFGAALRACDQFPLQVLQLPFDVPQLKLSLFWHERTHRAPAHHWVREAIRQVARTAVYKPPLPRVALPALRRTL